MKETTVHHLLTGTDKLLSDLADYIYLLENFPYDDDHLDIVKERIIDMSLNLPFIKTHVRNNTIKRSNV